MSWRGTSAQVPSPLSADAPHRGASSFGGRPMPFCRSGAGNGCSPGFHTSCALDADDIIQFPFGQPVTKLRIIAIGSIGQHHAFGTPRSPRSFEFRASAICGLVLNLTSAGTPAFFRRCLSLAHASGRYRRKAIGILAFSVVTDKTHGYPAVILLSDLSAILARHAHGMLPFLGKTGIVHDPRRPPDTSAVMEASTVSRTRSSNASSFHGASATKWCSDWCMRRTLSGASRAAIGSTLLRSPGKQQPRAICLERNAPIRMPRRLRQAIEICSEPFLLCAWRSR